MEKDSEKALINSLIAERDHLRINLKENVEMKEKFKLTSEKLEDDMNKMFKELVNLRRDKIGVDEIKKDRDARVKSMRAEITCVSNALEEIEGEHA